MVDWSASVKFGPTTVQAKYEDRANHGNTVTIDSLKYRRHDLILITGRVIYATKGEALGLDPTNQPAPLEQPR
jgi:predicted chitinase